jgi:hypothetical protein
MEHVTATGGTMIREDKQKKDGVLNINNGLPNLFVDDIRISIRNDNIATLNFFSDSPEGKFEQTRVTTRKERLKVFIDALCKHTDYYPKKPVVEKEEDKKKKK